MIDARAFALSGLTKISIPASVDDIGGGCFAGCDITSFSITGNK